MNLIRIETDTEYLVSAVLPGLDREQVEVMVDGNVLTIVGGHRPGNQDASGRGARRPRFQGTFERSFMLADDADADGVRADHEGCVLNLHIPKRQPQKDRQGEAIARH